jgi:peptidoglycan/xylan/chitin deacetylase (PgdA/CDA1 family)
MGPNYKTCAKIILSELGYYRRTCLKATRGGNRLLILMYHDLSPALGPGEEPEPLRAELSVDHFACHVKALVDSIRVITVRDAMAELRETGRFKENSVAITFDDGYQSVYTEAFPVLKQYSACATVFLLTGWLNSHMTLWWEDLADQLQVVDLPLVDTKRINRILGFTRDPIPDHLDNSNRARSRLLDRVSSAMMVLEDSERLAKMEAVRAVLTPSSGPIKPCRQPMSWDEARRLGEAGIELAAHTCNHKNMSFLSDEEAERELIDSKLEIERQTGQKVTGFAYPYGYDVAGYERFGPLLERCGYDYACTSWWGNVRSDSDRYRLYRNTLPPVTSPAMVRRELYLDLAE